MPPWFQKLRTWWQKWFFWQKTPTGSEEFRPQAHHDHALVLAVKESHPKKRWYQIRFINHVLPESERQLFWTSILVAFIALSIGGARVIQPHLIEVPTFGGTITEALTGTPKLINPLYAPLNDVDRDLSALIYSGLFRLNENLEAIPDIAEQYRWTDNGQTLEVTLRKDIRFHDNVPLTARDVVFTYETASNPSWRSPLATTLKNLQVIRTDDNIVQFHLTKPNPNLLTDLTLGILPAHIWEDVQGGTASLAEANLKPIGSGPYQLESFKRDQKGALLSFKLSKFPGYYGQSPYINAWQFRFYGDRDQAQAALQSKQVDALAFVPWKDVQELRHGDTQSTTLELPQETVAFLNVKDPLLKDIRVRQALSMAIDPLELQELVGNNGSLVSSPFPFLDTTSTHPGNIDGARILLNTIGWRLPSEGSIRVFEAPTAPAKPSGTRATTTPASKPTNASSTELSLTIDLPDQADLLKVAELLKRRWSLIGVRVDVRTNVAEGLLRQAVSKRNYQVLLWNVLLPPTQDISAFWASEHATNEGLNLSNLTDRDVDNALNAISAATSTANRETARRTLSAAILKQTPALFLSRPAYAYLLSKNIKGVQNIRASRPSDRLLQAKDWYIETSWKWR